MQESALKQSDSILSDVASKMAKDYLVQMTGEKIENLHDMFLEQIEPALFQAVIEKVKYNQVRAARILGISRGTFRKKLKTYFDDKYVGSRD